MALPTNPRASLVREVSAGIQTATASAEEALASAETALDKARIDEATAQLTGGLNSGLNMLAAAQGMAGQAAGAVSGLGGIASSVQTAASSIGLSNIADAATGAVSAISNFGGALNAVGSFSAGIANAAADIGGALSKIGAGNLAGGLTDLASGISGAAGALNNLLSLGRAKNIPSGAELFKTTGNSIKLESNPGNDWRVKIKAEWSLFNSPLFGELEKTGGVVFPYLPTITVSTRANYQSVETVHSNYPFLAYKNSSVDEITIEGVFTCENEYDAAYYLASTIFFKTATKMFFGQGENAGNPPPICILNGYGANVFKNIPVVIKSTSIQLPNDVNYIKCTKLGEPSWVPVKSNVSVTVQPVYSRTTQRKFSLQNYAAGKMVTGSEAGYL
jgi:hypothetical protein